MEEVIEGLQEELKKTQQACLDREKELDKRDKTNDQLQKEVKDLTKAKSA